MANCYFPYINHKLLQSNYLKFSQQDNLSILTNMAVRNGIVHSIEGARRKAQQQKAWAEETAPPEPPVEGRLIESLNSLNSTIIESRNQTA